MTTTITVNVNADTEGTGDAYERPEIEDIIDDLKAGKTGEGT